MSAQPLKTRLDKLCSLVRENMLVPGGGRGAGKRAGRRVGMVRRGRGGEGKGGVLDLMVCFIYIFCSNNDSSFTTTIIRNINER